MPISRRQLELGVTTEIEEWMRKVREFLAAHEDLAYTARELEKHFETPERDATERRRLQIALVRLVETGSVDQRSVGAEEYYAIRVSVPRL